MAAQAMNEAGKNDAESPRPFWNIVSVVLPLGAVALGLLLLAANPSGRGDFAGAIGSAALLAVGVGGASGLGAIAAIIALVRGERKGWLTAIGLLGNAAVVIPLLALVFSDG